MKKILIMILLCFAFAKAETHATTFIQKYVSHQVKKGETVNSIAKDYGLQSSDITRLNPDAKENIYEGLVLILPAQASQDITVEQEDLKFKTHKVRRKETLYSIAKKYKVPQEIIKKYNKRLYSEVLRKGDKIRVPINYKAPSEVASTTDQNGFKKHFVLSKETKYGIARKYGVTIAELEEMNPFIKNGLKEGVEIKVPERSEAESVIIDGDKFAFYEVQKGNTIYSLLRLFNIEADELIALNPGLEDGLKEGMILKIPKSSASDIATGVYTQDTAIPDPVNVIITKGGRGSLLDSLADFSTKRIAIMLPFGLQRMELNSGDANEELLRDDRVLRLSLDLYSGMLKAAEDAKSEGVSTIVDVYDTSFNFKDGNATNARKVEQLVKSNNFNEVDAVIGPLLGANINRVSGLLSSRNIPIVSPMSFNVNSGENIFISRPSDAILQGKMLSYVKKHGQGKNIVVVADGKNKGVQARIKAIFPNAKIVTPRTGDNGYFLYPDDLPTQIHPEQENWVFLETNDIPLISNVTTSLNAQVGMKKVTLFTTNKGNAYDSDEIQHTHLKNLSFHFPSVDREYKYSVSKKFIDSYEDSYGVSPSDYAIRGYDLMYDTLLRLAYAKDLYTAAATGIETGYIENKFRYGNRREGGFSNDAVYLMKYTETLTLEEVEVLDDY